MRGRAVPLLALLGGLGWGCTHHRGAIQLSVGLLPGPSDQVRRVTAQVLDLDHQPLSPPVQMDLVQESGRWSGLLLDVPSGDHVVSAQAYAADGTRLYHGEAQVTVPEGDTLHTFLQLAPDGGPQDHSPYITSVSISSITPDFGQILSMVAVVGDPDPADVPRLTYAWSATAGTFLDPTNALSTRWQAPPGPAPLVVTLTFQVTDPSNLSAVISIDIGVRTSEGTAVATAVVNSWPRIDSATAQVSLAAVGGIAALAASAHDPDGDAIHYSWSGGTCPGLLLTPTDEPTAQFQLGDLAVGASCGLEVTVDDGRGGSDQASIRLSSGPPGAQPLPVIDTVNNGAAQAFADAPVQLAITAHDPSPQGAPLSFNWAAANGTVDSIHSTDGESQATFRTGRCSGPASATVTVRNGLGGATIDYRFEALNCAPSCKELKALTPTLADGPYLVDPDGPSSGSQPPVTVFCDMTTDGGGWTFVSHYGAGTSNARVFDTILGTYQPNRSGASTYSLGILPVLADTEMMVTLDTADPALAGSRQSLVFFQYPPEHENFNLGPGPCTSIRPFGYRTTRSGVYQSSSNWACTATLWTPRDATNSSYLIQFGGPGVYLGAGLRTSGGDQGWGHEAWIYVR